MFRSIHFKYCILITTGFRGTRQRPNCTRQRTHGKKLIGKALFAECLLSGTRQRLCPEPRGHSAKKSGRHGAGPVDGGFAECQPCSHSAKIFYFFKKKFFAECQPGRHSAKSFYFFFENFLCRVPTREALGKDFLFF